MEYGNVNDFNWHVIKEGLRLLYDVNIGASKRCLVAGELCAPPCATEVDVDVYTAYRREYYRLSRDGVIAVISVLRPVDCAALVYQDVRSLSGQGCQPTSAQGVCASANNPPYVGITCLTGGSHKWNFEDMPAPGVEIPATWGQIKALYE